MNGLSCCLFIISQKILVGECKWSNISDGEALTAHLMEKAKKLPFVKGKKIVPMLFLKDCKIMNDNVLLPEDVINMMI